MDVAALCPFEVGVLRWNAPTAAITLVVKATWALAQREAAEPGRDAPLKLAALQDPVSGDQRIAGRDGLTWASDFVPYKPRADLLLIGHARAQGAATVIPVRLCVGEYERLVYAVAPDPSPQMPLAPSHLRVSPRADARRTAVGPSPSWLSRPLLGGPPRAELVGPSGVPLGPLGVDFDFGAFNVAPLEQQIQVLREDARLVLEGLGPSGTRIEARLPGVRPRVFLADGGGAPTQELAVACDTLAVDVDRMVCVTVWRGAIVLDPARGEPALVVVAAQSPGDVLDWPVVLGNIFAARCVRAAELAPAEVKTSLPRIYDEEELPTVGPRWADETTTRVREVFSSSPPPPRFPEEQTRHDRSPGPRIGDAAEDAIDDPDTAGPTRPRRLPKT